MALYSLNQLRSFRNFVITVRKQWIAFVKGVEIGRRVSMSMSCRLVPGHRGAIRIGEETLVAFKTLIYTRDDISGEDRPVRIGRRCFIGGGSMIMPGVTVGDECIVGAGAVLFDDVPPRSIVGGNPARILRSNIEVGAFGRLVGADENTRRLWKPLGN